MGGGGFASFRFNSQDFPCSGKKINTQLSSPNAEVIATLAPGDILDIELLFSKTRLVAVADGEVAGVIVNKEMLKIIECMKKGFNFQAVVRSVFNGRCAITIEPI
jgi:hypothetical protein